MHRAPPSIPPQLKPSNHAAQQDESNQNGIWITLAIIGGLLLLIILLLLFWLVSKSEPNFAASNSGEAAADTKENQDGSDESTADSESNESQQSSGSQQEASADQVDAEADSVANPESSSDTKEESSEKQSESTTDDTKAKAEPQASTEPSETKASEKSKDADEDKASKENDAPTIVKVFSSNNSSAKVRPSYKNRKTKERQALLKRFGGSEGTETAVELGLEWLKRKQKPEGNWSLLGDFPDAATSENKLAATGLALLAFLGHGDTHLGGTYKDVVSKGIRFLMDHQRPDGFFHLGRGSSHDQLYTHAICSIAICEAYGLTMDKKILESATKAVEFAQSAQGVDGGWRYEPKTRISDLSVTGWFVMLFHAAKYAGIPFDEKTFQRAEKFVRTTASENASRFGYLAKSGPSLPMTAEGLLCIQYFNTPKTDPGLNRGAKYLVENLIDWDNGKNVYYMYYATQVLRNMENQLWNKWNAKLSLGLPQVQVKTGSEKGSWDPQGDPYAGQGGRLYVTCLCICTLEVYYRNLPIYRP